MLIIVRTNGGRNIGLGHLMRSLSLAEAVRRISAGEILVASNIETKPVVEKWGFDFHACETFDKNDIEYIKKNKPHLIIFDSYLASEDYLRSLKNIARFAMFDDNNDIYKNVPADFLVNGNIHAENLCYKSENPNIGILLGAKYLVMKPEYWDCSVDIEKSEGILITTGGTDFHNIAPKIIDSLRGLQIPKKFIIGIAYTEEQEKKARDLAADDFEIISRPSTLQEHIAKSNLIISASGTSVYEILRMKKRPVIFEFADNQSLIADGLKKHGVRDIGFWNKINWDDLSGCIKSELSRSDEDFKTLWEKYDGQGAYRVAKLLLSGI